ncbi:MAG: amidohydrolase family protein [Candidatus Binatia bacterium]
MPVIDSDGHYHEPHYLFDQYMEKEYFGKRPRVLAIRDHALEEGRWVVEGKVVPRVPFTKGVGAGGFQYMTPRHKQMHMKDNSLDDVEGRLKDLDLLGVDIQVIYPTAFVFVADVEDKDLAAAICRAHNNYVADRCRKAPDRLKGVAIVPLQDPPAAIEEMRRALKELDLVAVTIPGIVGDKPLHSPEFFPFFKAANDLDCALGCHAVTGMHYTPWADCFKDFFSTHVTAMPFSMMVALMSVIRTGLMETLPNLRFAFLEIDGTWLHYWSRWVNRHVEDSPRVKGGYHLEPGWGEEPYMLPDTSRDPMDYIQSGRFLSGYSEHEDLRYLIDHLGSKTFMYASDYPHGDTEWERVNETRAMGTLTGKEKDAILEHNAARFYKL